MNKYHKYLVLSITIALWIAGSALISEGNVHPLLAELGYQFWDHGYNHQGLVRPDGSLAKASYHIPGNQERDNTDGDGLVELFSQPATDPPANAFGHLLQHEIIVFKSCFPNSAVDSDQMQEQFQACNSDSHPNRLANETIGPLFVQFIDETARTYKNDR